MGIYSAKLNARDFHNWSEDPRVLIFDVFRFHPAQKGKQEM
jgi:hypothetical protein